MIVKKFKLNKAVFQFKSATLTQCQENFSVSTEEAETAPWESRFMRFMAKARSSAVRNFACEGVCGRKKAAMMPKRMVMAPSMKKINGLKVYVNKHVLWKGNSEVEIQHTNHYIHPY